MAYIWQTVEEAAVTLGVSARTLHRRIGKGDVQTRLENGRREVLVSMPDTDTQLPPAELDSADKSETAVSQPAVTLSSPPSDTTLLAADERVRRAEVALSAFQSAVAMAQAEARRARSVSHFAWGAVGTLVAVLIVAVTWTTHRVTRAAGEVQNMTSELHRLSDMSDTRAKEVERLRSEAEAARIAAARAEGEMTALKNAVRQQVAQPPQEKGWLDGIVNILSDNK